MGMILLIGGRGFVGRAVQRVLRDRGLEFVLYDADINDFTRLTESLVGADVVINLAGGEARGRQRYLAYADVDGMETLVKALRQRRVERVITLSRINANPHATHPLLQAKGIAEKLLKESGVPFTVLRSATLFGREDRFTRHIWMMARRSWPFLWLPNGGRAVFQPLWVMDCARCLVATIERDDWVRRTVTVAGDERFHYKTLAQMVLSAANKSRVSVGLHPSIASVANGLTTVRHARPPLTRFDLDRMIVGEIADLDVVHTEFGIRPERLKHHLAHFRPNKVTRRAVKPL